jgi:hypothetical protein
MSSPEKRALYFGCLREIGHYLHDELTKRSTGSPREHYPDFPWKIGHLDGRLLKNGKVPDKPDGRVWWTCGGRPVLWFAFYWWDRSVDHRGASNSGFYVRGFEIGQVQEAFDYACKAWPQVVERQPHPLTLVLPSPGEDHGNDSH